MKLTAQVVQIFLFCLLICWNAGAKKHLTVTTILDSAYLSLRDGHEYYEGNEKFEGFLKTLTDLLAQNVNFTYELKLVKDSVFGYKQDDSTWNGMIGEILRREADMAVSSMTINSMRSEVVDFSTAFIQMRLAVLMKKPTARTDAEANNSSTQFLFIRPMTWQLWITFIFSSLSTIAILFFIEWAVHNRLWFGNKQASNEDTPASPENSETEEKTNFNFRLSEPRSVAGRVLQCSFVVYLAIMMSAYVAGFYSTNQIRNVPIPVQRRHSDQVVKIEELVLSNEKIKFYVIKYGSTANYLKTSSNPTLQRIYRNIVAEDTFVKSVSEGVDLVASSTNATCAFITEELTAKYSSSEFCSVYVATEPFGPKLGFGVVLPIKSHLLAPINLAITELNEIGVLNDLEEEWLVERGKCHGMVRSKQEKRRTDTHKTRIKKQRVKLSFGNIAGIFYIWIFAILFAGIAGVLEIRLKSTRATNKVKRSKERPEAQVVVVEPGTSFEMGAMTEVPL